MPSRSPVPFLIARSIVSFGMLTVRALSTAARRRGLAVTSPPPSRAEIVSSLMTLVQTFDRLESVASFLCLILDHRLWPDMGTFLSQSAVQGGPAPGVAANGALFQASAQSHAVCTSLWTPLPDQLPADTLTQPP